MYCGDFNARSSDKLSLPDAVNFLWNEIASLRFSQNEVAEGTSLLGCFNAFSTAEVQAVCFNLNIKVLQTATRP